jgi:hypothetical protein
MSVARRAAVVAPRPHARRLVRIWDAPSQARRVRLLLDAAPLAGPAGQHVLQAVYLSTNGTGARGTQRLFVRVAG